MTKGELGPGAELGRGAHRIVDAMNVIGSRPDGWWRDRTGAIERLVAALERWAEESGERVTVVTSDRELAARAAEAGAAVEPASGFRRALSS